jgi:hypothetical protein
MEVRKCQLVGSALIPLVAALPYEIRATREERESTFDYDASSQTTLFAGRGHSTCRYDESVNPIFGKSRSDTQKDD